MVPFQREMVVSCRLSVVTIVLSLDHLITICHHMSTPIVKSTGVDHIKAKFREEGVDYCKPNFNMIWERYGCVVWKRNSVDIFLPFEHSAQT